MNKAYLGIDVSKGYADFTFIDHKQQILENDFQLNDTQKDHKKLVRILKSIKEKYQLTEIFAAVESTGGYENNWYNFFKELELDDLAINIARINPYAIKHDSQAQMKRTITDKVSARQIAEYLVRYPEKVNYHGQTYNIFNSLRSQYNYICTLVQQKTQLFNQLEKHLYSVFPELLSYCHDGFPNWIIYLLCEFPTANQVNDASIDQLSQIPYISQNKAQIIKQKAAKSVAKIDDQVMQMIIKNMASDILSRIDIINTLKKSLEKEAHKDHEIQLLCSFMGIGAYSAVGILIEIEDINRFPSSKKMCSYFGLHPIYKKSGDGTVYIGMSKKGSSEIRGILYMVAKSAIVYNPHIKNIYNKHIDRGYNSRQTMGIIMHKILRIIYGMLKNDTPYDPEYDRKFQEQTIKYQKSASKQKCHQNRYTDNDLEAPISKREAKKRKEHQIASNSGLE
jgi:transposase